ncbi:hypothetical protein M231_07877 [Tremella mesenterica]|uniref:HIG1 domain-containing protein n=1 Tax=Tremella mesenterica TaxID=5217 RepID=A0A4Q1B814_TREME|nr:uncharacterized protein TREMEDRAFT_37242 [Tremella mesenterica DSM 1558]EIW73244.1 hypothetical protein TREMEDRAFT_37242 [Tremella mesenterica DSM 1558]RXK34859.1 hypothetical protein M231_07877 [Tremella mesenterica]
MKILTPEDAQAYSQATISGGIKGSLLGVSLWVPLHYTLLRRSVQYRALPLPLKAFGAVVVVLPCISITAEKAGEAYERSQWTGIGKRELDSKAQREEERWERMSIQEKVKDWTGRHKYGVIAGGWAASMGLAFGIVARSPMTFSQKLVQARMWAQGLTVAVLVGSAVVAGTSTAEEEEVGQREDHSWRAILEEEGVLKPGEKDIPPVHPAHPVHPAAPHKPAPVAVH